MTVFTIKLAGIVMEIRALYEASRTFCKDYLCEEEPEFSIVMEEADIEAEAAMSARQNKREGIPVITYSPSYLETLAIYRKIAEKVLDHDTILMHGAVVAHAGKAYLFTAKSGTGKTTHTRLWLKNIRDTHMLNGDKPLLRVIDDKVYACGTPWMGKENLGRNEILPLESICILERGDSNEIEEITGGTLLPVLIGQTYQPSTAALVQKKLMLVMKIGKTVRPMRLKCTLDIKGAEKVSFEAMTGESYEENEA